ncbi:MAG TPA: YeeE/YedE thiosulfate transporter family protein [Candidatus Eisenbacteria bacterium]|nr:YeeE/YedE thiosulfate transporter family protein [Candidatus Eisenbacteria bacterium]
MSAPYVETLTTVSYVVAGVILGFFFGFFLERAGFSSARKLTDQFYFKDFSVLKVMFTAIIVAMLGITYFSLLGWLNFGQVYVPETFVWPQLVGGILLGAGFIVGGYCPGTSVVAAAIGKIDGLLFIVGILIGIFGFGGAVSHFQKFYLSGALGPLTIPQWLNVNAGVVAFAVAMIALGAFWAAEKCEGKWRLFGRTYGKESQVETRGQVSAVCGRFGNAAEGAQVDED